VNVLTESGIVRSDITTSFGTASGLAYGVPLTITLTVLDTANGSAPLEGAAVDLWHCDQAGRYSLYSDGVTSENYLRGVQEAAADGTVTSPASTRLPTPAGGAEQAGLRDRRVRRQPRQPGPDLADGAQRAGLTIQVSRPGAPPSDPPASRQGR
jgi:hypothetical protein